jgi:hypothetical protein
VVVCLRSRNRGSGGRPWAKTANWVEGDWQACGARDRREKPKQPYPAIAVNAAAEERGQEGEWKCADVDSQRQASACNLPERSLGKVFAPEDLPASDGPSVSTEERGKLADSAW